MVLLMAAAAVGHPGADLYAAHRCGACHGAQGAAPTMNLYPRINGQSADYLLRQMIDIRDGMRTNGLSAAMRATMSGVPDDALAPIADWLSRQ